MLHHRTGDAANDNLLARPKYASLFPADLFDVVTQKFFMIQADAGDDRKIGIDNIERIKAPAKANFENRQIDVRLLESEECDESGEFEVSQSNGAASGLNGRKAFAQLRIRHRFTGKPHPFVERLYMRRERRADGHALSTRERFGEHGRGAFTVGACDDDVAVTRPQDRKFLGNFPHTRKTHVDLFDMERVDVLEPLRKVFAGHGRRCDQLGSWCESIAARSSATIAFRVEQVVATSLP